MHPALEVRGTLSRSVFVVALLVSLAVLFAPARDVPAAPPGVDKAVHLLLFAGLAVTGEWAGVRLRLLAPLLAVYAALSEVLQASLPLGRSGDVADLVADLAGVSLGLALGLAVRRLGDRSGRRPPS